VARLARVFPHRLHLLLRLLLRLVPMVRPMGLLSHRLFARPLLLCPVLLVRRVCLLVRLFPRLLRLSLRPLLRLVLVAAP
jgi:hypothetical protein